MTQLGPALTCNGYNSVTGKCASTSIPSSVAASDYDTYLSGGTPYNDASASAEIPSSAFGGFFSGLADYPFLQVLGVTPNTISGGKAGIAGASVDSGIDAAAGVAKGTGALLAIVTDLPRIATIVIGGILITAGVFALASHHDINIMETLPKG